MTDALVSYQYFPWHLIVFFYSFFSERDLPLEANVVGGNVKDQNISFSDKESKQSNAKPAYEDSMALVSQEKGGQRKRGRPAGSGGIKKVKPSGNQARRARAQTVKKRAKLCEYESDGSDSGDKRPSEQETDTREGSLEFYKKHQESSEQDKTFKLQETEKHEDVQSTQTVESSEQDKTFKLEDWKDSKYERMSVPKIEMSDWNKHPDQNSQVTDKLEILTDPMQAMLFDLIPSLAPKKVEHPTDRNVREEKQPEVSNTGAEPSTTKKKKVSYKDLAGKLLKDW